MSHVTLQTILILIQAALISGLHYTKADVIKACIDFTPCTGTYANINDALASADNSFNIESALYPATKPSSVRVFVNVYGPNKTDNSTTDVKYTWSINCLYAAFPAGVLELLSLGSILVTSRTQELNITIPQFCCNISVDKRQKMIKEVVATLQDLAVNPSVRDPRLNSAECVTEGHKADIEATGRLAYIRIRAMLWCSFVSVFILGPLLAFYTLNILKLVDEKDCVCCNKEPSSPCCCYKQEKPLVLSVNYFICYFLVPIELIIVIHVLVKSVFHELFAILGMMLEGIAMCVIQCAICKSNGHTECDFCKTSSKSLMYKRLLIYVAGANIVLYHLYWLIIGIMINPTWGLTVFLVVCLVIVALFYVIYKICDVDEFPSSLFVQRFSIFTAAFLGLCLAAAVPVLAGQSFYGRETADDIMKTALLYVINFLTLWMFRNAPTPPATTNPVPPHNPIPTPTPAQAPPNGGIELHRVADERWSETRV